MHEVSRRRRAQYASRGGYTGSEEGDMFGSERWAKPGWGEGFAAPKREQGEWREDGPRERLILAFGVAVNVAPHLLF